MTHIRLSDVSDQPSVVLPPEIAAKLGVQPGDQLEVVETEHGIEIRCGASGAESQLEVAKQIMDEDAPVLRKLAE